MKRVWRKTGGFVLFFCLLTGAGYFLPFLSVPSAHETSQNIIEKYEKTLPPQDESLFPEYEEWLSSQIKENTKKYIPLNSVETKVRTTLTIINPDDPQISWYDLKSADVVVFVHQHDDEDNLAFTQNISHLKEKLAFELSEQQNIHLQVVALPNVVGFWGHPAILILSQSIAFMCLSSLIVLFFIVVIPFIVKKRRFNKTFNTLNSQIASLCIVPSNNRENDKLLTKARQICQQTPQEALRVIRSMLLNVCVNPAESLFSPAQRAGILILAIGPKPAKKVFKRMSESEVRTMNHLISCLGRIKQEDTRLVLKEFCQTIDNPENTMISKSADHSQTQPMIVSDVLPIKQATLIAQKCDSSYQGKDIWGHLETVPSEKIAKYLKDEYPQTMAVILYHLSDEKAGSVLNLLSVEESGGALLRLTALKSLGRDKLKSIEAGLEVQFLGASASILYKGYQKASNILSLMNKSDKNKLIRALSHRAPQVAKRLSRQVICFDDFADFEEDNIRLLIKKTPRAILLNALIGADSATKEAFARNIEPKLWGKMLKKLSQPQTGRIKDIDEAQCYIIKKARALIESGKMKRHH